MARHRVLIAVAVVFDGDYYEPSELVPETWRWIEGTLEDRDDLKSAEMLHSLVLGDPEDKVRITFDGGTGTDAAQHWAPEPPDLPTADVDGFLAQLHDTPYTRQTEWVTENYVLLRKGPQDDPWAPESGTS